ncbi:DUF55-domain-containing protein [Hypoxylon sp. FL1284]|nr:DUF55-domain-containing protein [Hypoxylon sp. FL1284]
MPKRKANNAEEDFDRPNLRRSARRKQSVATEVSKSAPEASEPARQRIQKQDAKTSKGTTKSKSGTKDTAPSSVVPTTEAVEAPTPSSETSYWLMKAEPESRFERGVDVKFSIDDLASRTEPEPWDGIRNYVARNNLRAMKKGDVAFFYHSNCKEPGIVGTMEIVQEHSPDLSAHDPAAPYYDASSKPGNPKWSVVHVNYRSKFKQPIGLKELREMGKPGQPLEDMQMLKQSRLSVSRVSPDEFRYLMTVVKQRGGETT